MYYFQKGIFHRVQVGAEESRFRDADATVGLPRIKKLVKRCGIDKMGQFDTLACLVRSDTICSSLIEANLTLFKPHQGIERHFPLYFSTFYSCLLKSPKVNFFLDFCSFFSASPMFLFTFS